MNYTELHNLLYHGSNESFVLTEQAIDAAIDIISGYIVSVVALQTGKSIEAITEAFLTSDTYTLLSDAETGYYWDSIGELIDKFTTEIQACCS